jgi:hypothetical protein
MLSALLPHCSRERGGSRGANELAAQPRGSVAAWQRGKMHGRACHRIGARPRRGLPHHCAHGARRGRQPGRGVRGGRRRPRPHTRSSLVESLAIRRAGAGRLGWRPRIHLLMTQIDRSQQSAAAPCRRVQILTYSQSQLGPSQSRPPVHACDRMRRVTTARVERESPRPRAASQLAKMQSQDGQAGAIKGNITTSSNA